MDKLSKVIEACCKGWNHDITILTPSHDKAFALFDKDSCHKVYEFELTEEGWVSHTIYEEDKSVSCLGAILCIATAYDNEASIFLNRL